MSSPQQLGQYRIEAQLDSARYVDTYRAVDTVRKRAVTLYVWRVSAFPDPAVAPGLLQAPQAAADLVHPHLAWVWETGDDAGEVYVVERHIPATTLRQRLAEHGPLSWAEASQVIEHLAAGLDFAHGRGHVHGGVRPETIYLSPDLGAVLAGFGAPPASLHPGDEDAQLAPYTAPEVWLGETPSPAADRYALACVWVEMLTGRPMFNAPTGEQICEQQLSDLVFPSNWPAGTPWQIEPALERALARQPEARYASAAELAAAPAALALRGAGDEEERRRREKLRQERRQAEEQARREAEETARLAALEQARRDLETAAHGPSQAAGVAALADAAIVDAALAETAQVEPEDRKGSGLVVEPAVTGPETALPAADTAARRRNRRPEQAAPRAGLPRWQVLLTIGALLLALGWLWNARFLGGAGTPTATSTPTVTHAATALPAIIATASSTQPQPTATYTATASRTPTATPRPTLTRTPTATFTASPTPTNTRPPFTPTRTRRDRPDD